MEIEDHIKRLTIAFLDAQREQIVKDLSENLKKQSGLTDYLPAHCDLFDLARAHIQEPSPRHAIAGVHRVLAREDCWKNPQPLISGQIILWKVVHRMLREVEGPHKRMGVIHCVLALAGDTVDGLTGVLIDVAQSGDTSVAFPGWRTLVEIGRTYREFRMLHQIIRDLLDSRDPAQMFEILEAGILGAFHLRSLAIASVSHEEGFVEVVRAYPVSSPTRDFIVWRYDLSHPDILCDVARTGRMEVIDGWDPRYHERIAEADDSASFRQCPQDYNADQTAFFVPIFARDCVIGIICTASTRANKRTVLREVERMRPFLDQVGVTLSNISEIVHRQLAEELLKEFSQQIIQLQEEERRRVGLELHDGVSQILSGIKFRIEGVQERIASTDRTAQEEVRKAGLLLEEAIREIRRISQNLRPFILDDLGLKAAVLSLCEAFTERTQVKVDIEFCRFFDRLDDKTETTLYRILQEALNNVEKHAQATRVDLRFFQEDAWVVMILQDNGTGFEAPSDGHGRQGSGLRNMRERAHLAGGRLTVQSTRGRGTELLAQLPFNGEEGSGDG